MEETVIDWVVPGKKQQDVYTPFPCNGMGKRGDLYKVIALTSSDGIAHAT